MGNAQHLQHQLRVAFYGVLRDSADRLRSRRRRPARSDCQAQLSTARKVREDYFGHGGDNGVDFFSIPVHIADGTGPNQGRFGTLGRNTFRGPAFYNFDFAFIKDTPFGRRKSGAERMDLQFRAELFNLFNIVTMGLPSNTLQVNQTTGEILRNTGFGKISKTAGNSRQIQFSLKLIY